MVVGAPRVLESHTKRDGRDLSRSGPSVGGGGGYPKISKPAAGEFFD